MTNLLITLTVEDVNLDPIGAKESVAMALEGLGGVRVLEIDAHEPEQLRLDGGASRKPNSRRTPPTPAPQDKPSVGTSSAQKPGRPRTTEMACCLTCAFYAQGSGKDRAGKYYWGLCGRTHSPVYSLKDQCRSWMTAWRA